MLEEPFSSGTSLLHSLDARCKILTAFLSAVTFALLTTIPAATGALLYSTMLILLAQLPARQLVKRLLFVNLFIGMLWLFLPFSTPGTPQFAIGPLTATTEGVHLTGLITLKSNAIVLAFIALVATSTITEAGAALSTLHVPHKLSLLFLFTWRYIHVIAQEYERLNTAARIRGFVPSSSLHTYRTYANLAAMVLVRSWDRAERVNHAMRLRGFTGTFHPLKQNDTSISVLAPALLLSVPAFACMGFELYQRFAPFTGTP